MLEDKTIIDLTGDQFYEGAQVYLGKENAFYKSMEFSCVQDNYDIQQNERLWHDYLAVVEKLEQQFIV